MKLRHIYFHAMRKILDKINRGKRIKRTIFGEKVLDIEKGSQEILKLLETDKPAMIGRIGTVEMGALNSVLNYKLGLIKSVPSIQLDVLCNNAGFFGASRGGGLEDLEKFFEVYEEAAKEMDIAVVFKHHGEDYFYKTYSTVKKYVELRALEPYYADIPWTKVLKGKKVLVIHPFAESIESQYQHREVLFENAELLPKFELQTFKAVQTIGRNTAGFESWFDALEYMKQEIQKKEFDIALIGCGAYAFPLAAHIKQMGKKAVVTGGATQIFFGIKGKRWDNHPEISKLYNKYWIRPKDTEIPKDSEKVEGGCYW